jgi:hypothetical protein
LDINIQSVFGKIREISAEGIDPRPYIAIATLQNEFRAGLDQLGPYLSHLKKMRLIIFNHKAPTAVKLTHLGQQWESMPR